MLFLQTQARKQSSTLRSFVLAGAGLMITVAIVAVVSSNEANITGNAVSLGESGMPDPVQAVQAADTSVASVAPFHGLDQEAGAHPHTFRLLQHFISS